MSLLLVPRATDLDGSRKVTLDTTHTRGERGLPWIQTPVYIQLAGIHLDTT